MKKKILFILPLLFANAIYSQVLYNETFDTFTVGTLGTDTTGGIPGQGGWFTKSYNTQSNTMFAIVNETGRGKVLDITSPLSTVERLRAFKPNLGSLIYNRTPGNNVLKFEIDYYTGSIQAPGVSGNSCGFLILYGGDPLSGNLYEVLAQCGVEKTSGVIGGTFKDHSKDVFYDDTADYYYLPFNNWVKLIVYLDYTNKKAYFEI